MFKRIDHVEIIPQDFERTIKFYTDVLTFRIKERKKIGKPPLMEIIYLQLGDTMLEIMQVETPGPAPSSLWHVGYPRIALEVEHMDQAIEYLKSRGIKVSLEPVNLGTSIRAEIEDPDGLSIELRQWGI